VPLAALPLVSARVLWASVPASYSDIIRQAYPVGNGRLGGITLQGFKQWIAHHSTAMPFGPPGSDKVNINVGSL